MKVAIIGGGAAGFFAAFSVKEHHPSAVVTIFEKSDKLLSKVKISGGGRCNVTHACFKPSLLSKHYPRGEKQLKRAFAIFQPKDTVEWFSKRGVALKAESDYRMFPESDDSQTIIDCFLKEAQSKNITICKKRPVSSFTKNDTGISLAFKTGNQQFDKVILATGGSPKLRGFEWLQNSGHSIVEPLPSLFTFNMPKEPITELMGLVVEKATVRIQATKLEYSGPVLITHWGMSGPAILKLSAWGARLLFKKSYQFNIQVNWLSIKNEEEVNSILTEKESTIRKKKIANANPFALPNRMWMYLLEKVQINPDLPWYELSKKNKNKLINVLLNDVYEVCGKTTFKEEFVTSGGVSLEDVDFNTMESKQCKNLYFAGEVLNIDGITGGFNFQAAWTTGYIAGKLN
jgi:predicted Rossmann fold flavoprotein